MKKQNLKYSDAYEASEKCNKSAKKWLKRFLASFIICILSCVLFFLNAPLQNVWSWTFCLSGIFCIIALAMAYSRWTDKIIYADWRGWI